MVEIKCWITWRDKQVTTGVAPEIPIFSETSIIMRYVLTQCDMRYLPNGRVRGNMRTDIGGVNLALQ